jgi:hypothetical protein
MASIGTNVLESPGSDIKDRPTKDDYSHPHDALQYLCLGLRSGAMRNNHARGLSRT